ncbi:acyltransferase 3 [Stanieria cyanosphaera PCC 7437]|uniref:Acyltransferase 3 n=1 Tax=Stanieria cyanosphaera (strain ATCC 29371 / PCC 7437) TaxID=111780 RepID=K9XYE8_STAC7|nr:acyltransferase [Stanieria cyanosphaera]AFZ37146.1 acyltransferase 3 [Stanieria cyanosphaera PCC 7437]
MNKNLSKKRLIWLDQIKGLAILGIVFFHFFQNYPKSIPLIEFLAVHGAKVGFAAVDIFFLLSGFHIGTKLINFNNYSWLTWLNQRVIRIYPTYWLAIIFSIFIYLIASYPLKSINFSDWILILSGFPGYERFKLINPGFWFVSVIIQAYLVMPLLLYITQNKPKKILLLGISLGILNKIVCWWAGATDNQELYWFFLQNNFLSSYIFPLCLGIYWGFIYSNYHSFRNLDWQVAIIACLLGLIIQINAALIDFDFLYKLGLDLFYTPLIFLLLFYFCEQLTSKLFLVEKKLQLIGLYSYQIYLIHQPLFFVLLNFVANRFDLNSYQSLVITISIVMIILSLYVYLFTQTDVVFRKLMGNIYKNA